MRATIGAAAETALFESLPADAREGFDHAVSAHEFYPTAPLVTYLRAYAAGDVSRLEALGQALSPANIASSLSAMRVARTPEAVLHVVQPLMARFHDWGRLVVDHRAAREATLHIQMPREFAPEMCHYLAGVARSLLATSGRKARVETQTCMAHGADECALGIRWGEG